MEKLFERHSYQRSLKEKYTSLVALYIKEAKVVINNLPTKKIPHPDGFTGKYYQPIKEKISIS